MNVGHGLSDSVDKTMGRAQYMSEANTSKRATSRTRVFIEDDPSVAVLLEEYKLHRAEAAENSAKNNRQVTYIQIYGLFLATVAGVYYQVPNGEQVLTVPAALTLPVLVIAASLLFYLYSQIYLSSYTFRVLRMRMEEIEGQVNQRVGSEILRYEREIAPEFFGRPMVHSRYLSPNTWLHLFLVSLFLAAAYLVAALAFSLLDHRPSTALFYNGSLAFFTFSLLWEHYKLSRSNAFTAMESSNELSNMARVLRLARYFLNYFVVIFLVFVFAFERVDNWVAVQVHLWIDHLFFLVDRVPIAAASALVSLYTALCAIFLPTPSELPLVLVEPLGWSVILISSAIGKGIGAVILMSVSRLYFRLNGYGPESISSVLNGSAFKSIASDRSAGWVYLLCQSVPFFPMRSATVAYAAVSGGGVRGYLTVGIGSAIGTILRMLLLWLPVLRWL